MRRDSMITIYGSSRENGNTEELAKAVLSGIDTEEVYLRQHTIHPITDMRHDEHGFTNQQDDYYDIAKKNGSTRYYSICYTSLLVRYERIDEELCGSLV